MPLIYVQSTSSSLCILSFLFFFFIFLLILIWFFQDSFVHYGVQLAHCQETQINKQASIILAA